MCVVFKKAGRRGQVLAINTSEVAVLMKGGNCEQPLGEDRRGDERRGEESQQQRGSWGGMPFLG